MFDSDDESPLGGDVSADSSCNYTPTDSSDVSKHGDRSITRCTDSEEVSRETGEVDKSEGSSARKSLNSERLTSTMLSPVREHSNQSVAAMLELDKELEISTTVVPDTPEPQLGASMDSNADSQDSPGSSTGSVDMSSCSKLAQPVTLPTTSPASCQIQQKLWKSAAEAATRAPVESSSSVADAAAAASDGDWQSLMERGAGLEDENIALQLQLEGLALQISELQSQAAVTEEDKAQAEAETNNAAVETAQCLLDLSDHTHLILTAYGADKTTLEEGLAAAQQRCQATEAASAAGLQNADISRKELADLQKELRDARAAFGEAQDACKAAESAREEAQAEANRLKEELLTAKKKLEGQTSMEKKQQTPKVKRMIAQLEVASAALHAASTATLPVAGSTAKDLAHLTHQICQRENAALLEEKQEAEERLQHLKLLSASKSASALRSGQSYENEWANKVSKLPSYDWVDAIGEQGTPQAALPEPATPGGQSLTQAGATSTQCRPRHQLRSNLRFFGHQRMHSLNTVSPEIPCGRPALDLHGSPCAHPSTPGCQTLQNSPIMQLSTPIGTRGTPSGAGSQFLTPLRSVLQTPTEACSPPAWVSPVPLERWNLITERLKVLRLELKDAQSKLTEHSASAAAQGPRGLQLLLPKPMLKEHVKSPSPLAVCRINQLTHPASPVRDSDIEVERCDKDGGGSGANLSAKTSGYDSSTDEENSPPVRRTRPVPLRGWAHAKVSQSKADEENNGKAEVLRKAAALGIRLPSGYQRRWARR